MAAAAFSGALAVTLGAFGAHALEGALELSRAAIYETASQYHFVHVLALLFATQLAPTRYVRWAAAAFGWGQIIFCGSLYVLATRGLLGLEGASWLGAITPVGGLAFIAGWVLLGVSARRRTS